MLRKFLEIGSFPFQDSTAIERISVICPDPRFLEATVALLLASKAFPVVLEGGAFILTELNSTYRDDINAFLGRVNFILSHVPNITGIDLVVHEGMCKKIQADYPEFSPKNERSILKEILGLSEESCKQVLEGVTTCINDIRRIDLSVNHKKTIVPKIFT